ncbi:D-alanyl-D-alanine carboxypeptidase family protein [Gudongella sp. SC589]|jgi:D-alanyl-D-alanine carboxypeptidase|uniref:D-alanyl-D-alanine carboxypeptidase family protein n=1 Tax=Gudongella sp. SC589 TaxID=3385990 RepID=UPI003904A2B7
MHLRLKMLLGVLILIIAAVIMVPRMLSDNVESPEEPVGQEPAEETGGEEFQDTYLFTTDYLNMRTGPGTEHEKIRTIPVGEKVRAIGYEDGWYQIEYKGQIGYSIGEYLSELLEEGEDNPDSPEIEEPEETQEEDETGEMMKIIDGILLVNKTYGLPSDYYPDVDPQAKMKVEEMIKAARDEINKEIIAFSGFRSYNYQKKLYNSSVETDGEEYAQRYSAKPGHSEHQTGLAFDLGGQMKYWLEPEFADTEEGIWLADNAHRFGFILRYPKDKEHITGYAYEPWHFRYVGEDHAGRIYEGNLTLEEYLLGENQ